MVLNKYPYIRVCIVSLFTGNVGGRFLQIRVLGFVHFLLPLPHLYILFVWYSFYIVWVVWSCVMCFCVGLKGKVFYSYLIVRGDGVYMLFFVSYFLFLLSYQCVLCIQL